MKTVTTLLFVALAASINVRAQVSTGSGGEGVAVGNSDLIGTVQESDSFTFGAGASGTRNGESYNAGAYPLSGQDAILESAYISNHSATSPSWETSAFSLNNDTHYVDVTTNGTPFFQTYPGSSGAGSVSGFTQTGLGYDVIETNGPITIHNEEDHSVAYGGGTNFVVQADAVQTSDRIDINIGSQQDTILASDGLTVFFRASGGGNSIGLWNANVGESDPTFGSSNVTASKWNNYAVGFNLNTDELSIYTNEVLDGTVDLKTFDGGAYLSELDANSTAFVGVGGATPQSNSQTGLLWTDNFQVGTAVPEPTTWAMLIGGLAVLVGIGRRRCLNS